MALKWLKYLTLSILFVNYLTCTTVSGEVKTDKDTKVQAISSSLREELVDYALTLVGRETYSKVMVKDRQFTLDCIGTLSAIFYSAGIDIREEFHRYGGNGVSRFYYTLKERELLFREKSPEPGDVIFWDNTWDKNEDGQFGNDPLTHAGLVIKTEPDGTIHYLHANYVYGIVVEVMNLKRPSLRVDENGKRINTAMHVDSGNSTKRPKRWLSGDLFKEYGRVVAK